MLHKDGNTNASKENDTTDELHQEAKHNRETDNMHEKASEQSWQNSQQNQQGQFNQQGGQQREYVDGGFNQQSFQDAFKTNDGKSAEQAISSLIDGFYKPISTGALNERTTKIIDIFKEHYKQAQEADQQTTQVDFIQAPGTKISHFYGGFIVSIPVQAADGTPQVSAHLVIVESRIKMQPRVENLNGTQFTFYNTAGNTVTADTMVGVEKLVRAHYRNDKLVFINGGFTVIPVEVELDDLTTLNRLVEYTAEAAYARLHMFNINSVEDEGIKLAQAAAAKSVRWAAQIEEKPQAQTDVTGQLIRTDFSIKTSIIPIQNQNQQYQLGALEFGEVNVFCSPVYAEPQQMPLANGMWGPVSSQHYYNRVIIKDFRNGPSIRMSIGSCLMLLATTSSLAINNVWQRAYIPNRHIDPSQTDIHDIGAIGYEVPMLNPENYTVQGQPPRKEMIKTKTADFTNEKFNMLMSSAFYQDLLYCIDVPDGHYLLGLFVAEANGNTNARNIIGKILNVMTGGKFYEQFPSDAEMFYTDGERVINGYYVSTTTGQMRPLDDVDHLALLNITSGGPEWIKNWEQFDNSQTPQELRLARRAEIIQAFAEDRAVIKSYSTRITVKPAFMEALSRSLLNSGLFPQLTTNMNTVSSYNRASANQFANLVINPSHIPNVFAGNGGNQYGNYQGFGTQPYSGGPWG